MATSSGSRTPSFTSASVDLLLSDPMTLPSASTSMSITAISPWRTSRSTGVISASGSRRSSRRRSSISSVTSCEWSGGSTLILSMSPRSTAGITLIVAFSFAGFPRSSSRTSTSGLSIGSMDSLSSACRITSGTIVSTTSSRSTAGPSLASTSARGACPGRKPSIFAREANLFRTRSYVASTTAAGTSMFIPTWLLGRRSVTTDNSAAIRPQVYGGLALDQTQGGMPGDGHGVGTGLATIGPTPVSGGTTYVGVLGVGLGGLSPGSLAMLRASSRYQLLFGPATTPGGAVYQRLPGIPASALETKVWTPGEATNTPSEPYFMKWRLSRMSPTQRPVARSGVNAMVAASLKLSVVPVFAATVRSFQCSWLLQPKIMQRFWSSAMIWAMMKATAGSIASRARWLGWSW